MGFLANCYQGHCRNDIWPKVHRPTLKPKRKATSEKLRFFWGRVYRSISGCVLDYWGPKAPGLCYYALLGSPFPSKLCLRVRSSMIAEPGPHVLGSYTLR